VVAETASQKRSFKTMIDRTFARMSWLAVSTAAVMSLCFDARLAYGQTPAPTLVGPNDGFNLAFRRFSG
jgi:hypothetical protein